MQRKNLLEAFRHAGSQPAQESDSAGPFAGGEPARPRGRAKSPKKVRDAGAPGMPAVPSWAPWMLGLLLAFVVGLAVGRGTVPVAAGAEDATAQESASGSDGSRWSTQESGRASRSSAGIDEAPSRTEPARREANDPKARFLDRANRYTIVAITYGRSRRDYADASRHHLLDQGFDVMPLVEYGDNFVVLVGAAPEVDDLRSTRERLTRMESFDGSPAAYADAYIEQIDRLFDR